eukprot:1158714-Pelagomonas_calceolata.AAC.3
MHVQPRGHFACVQYNEAGQVVVPATPSSGRETHWKVRPPAPVPEKVHACAYTRARTHMCTH